MNRELDKIFDAIDAQRLTIQWDVCQEVLVFENYYPERGPTYKADIFAELGRLGNAIPDAANLGFHLCYGSPRDEHMVQPVDMAVLVEIAHGILGSVDRAVQFIHMPVPKDRTDENYYQPLRNLKRPDETALFLGLVHHGDETGNRTRLARAQSVTTVQGISAECGWGRTDPERVPGLLQAHRQLAG